MIGIFVVRHFVPLSQLRTNNEVAGFKFATVGVLYAVLLAFAVIVVWEKFNEAESNVALEAGAAVTLYRLAMAWTQHGTRASQGDHRLPRGGRRRGLAGDGTRRGERAGCQLRRSAGSTLCCFGSSRSISAARSRSRKGCGSSTS